MEKFKRLLYAVIIFLMVIPAADQLAAQGLRGFDTNTSKKSIVLDELLNGGPGKDGIPAINNPVFVSQEQAAGWIEDQEPVIALEIDGKARAYPIQILIWHEIVNDELSGVPVLVTFCPLCYSAIVFDRDIDGEVHEFGVSGFLRHSDMIMFDRKTDSLWQQFSGEALVGDYTGKELTILPSQLISFQQFREAYPDAMVLSKNTGYRRNYGDNPYAGYDDINNSPFLMRGEVSDKVRPMEKIVGVRTKEENIGYTYTLTREKGVYNDEAGGEPIVIFHVEGMASALDDREIRNSRDDGATGVFSRRLNGEILEFEFVNNTIRDTKTQSVWDITGKAVRGEFAGEQLSPVKSGDYFAFAWLVFYPESRIVE
jgi:hypothetical protein